MRSAALCLLALAAPGCNWVFGIDATVRTDAGMGDPTDGPLPFARLSYMVADSAQGMPVSPALAPILPAPTVEIGRLDGALMPAIYQTDGTIRLPYDFADGTRPWRLVYQLANDVPHEVQWNPLVGSSPHAVVPIFGRLDRALIPGPNTAVSLTPMASPLLHRNPRVFTTGVWTESQQLSPPPGANVTHNLNDSLQLSGPPGAPEAARGDLIFLVDFTPTTICRSAEGSAAFSVPLVDGVSMPTPSSSTGTWSFTSRSVAVSGDTITNRLRAATITGADPSELTQRLMIGRSPSTVMPAFSRRLFNAALRVPVMLTLQDCTNADVANLPTFGQPPSLVDYPEIVHLQLSAPRTVSGGPTLYSGLSTLTPTTGTTSGAAALDFSVASALPPFTLGGSDLANLDRVQLAAGTEPLELMFAVEAAPQKTDYYEVILHRVTGTSIVAERIYTITAPPLRIDRTLLANNAEYVIEIRAFNGAPGAAVGDFTRYTPTQSSAVVFTHTFLAP